MAKFLSRDLAELTRQLTYTPVARRLEQIERAEQLYWQTDPQLLYPLAYIAWRITRYRLETVEDVMLTGLAVRADLPWMVRQLSQSLRMKADQFAPNPLTLAELGARWKVTPKTLSRFQKQGLFCRRAVDDHGRFHTLFLPVSIERFEAHRPRPVVSSDRPKRLDGATRRLILDRARRITRRAQASPFAVARHLARKFGRTTEAIRLLLLNHDRRHPEQAIFPRHTGPLDARQQRVIARAFRRGIAVGELARRFDRARSAIYRAIHLQRLAELRQTDIRCVPSPTFGLPDAEEVILHARLDLPDPAPNPARPHALIDPATEAALFIRYNYLKHRAIQARDRIDELHPQSNRLDEAETHLRHAAALRQRLVGHYMRWVESQARKHLAGRSGAGNPELADLVGQGHLVLLETIDTFDAGKETRFSTYLTWALRRRFSRMQADARRAPAAMPDASIEPADLHDLRARQDSERREQAQAALRRLLSTLAERERLVLRHRFGLGAAEGEPATPRTLIQVAALLGISAERTRQVERTALVKLRRSAERLGLSLRDLELDGTARTSRAG
jgi:RNA polymerase sigma factor (sigma-70 family)